jgi:GNAT superfamily N-acetyltransferase
MRARLFEALLATWAPAETRRQQGWTLRRGEGGGNRVSSATLDEEGCDIAVAEAAMRAWGQRPTFMIRPGDETLDRRLDALGYMVDSPTLIVAADPEAVTPAAPDHRAILGPEPLAVMREIWAAGGVGPAKLAVMARVTQPKTYLLGRSGDAPAACAFAACDREIGMLQALEVAAPFRRQGLGTALTRAAAAWAAAQRATIYALAVEVANAPARAAYARLGMRQVAAYHYRLAPE